MRFKKMYIEITNICNMNCSFCPPHNRRNEYMNLSDFKTILSKIRPYTKYIYLHVKGEPMLHPQFDEFVKIAHDNGFNVNVTTNGTLLKNHLETVKFIRQLNISLHATNKKEIIETAKSIKSCYVNFRVWNVEDSLDDNETIKLLENAFNINLKEKTIKKMNSLNHDSFNSETNFTIKDNFYLSIQNEFTWPGLSNEESIENGYCHALKDHIAILVDGTVVPCCLDNNGDIALGNIFKDELSEILNSKRALEIIDNFKNRKCVEELCKKCEYKRRF